MSRQNLPKYPERAQVAFVVVERDAHEHFRGVRASLVSYAGPYRFRSGNEAYLSAVRDACPVSSLCTHFRLAQLPFDASAIRA